MLSTETINGQIGLSIDKISNPTKRFFYENYGLKSQPVLITGLMDTWLAKNLWTMDYIKNRVGDFEEYGFRKEEAIKKFKISDYINYWENNSDPNPYCLENCQFHLITDMINHYTVPDYFPNCMNFLNGATVQFAPGRFFMSWLNITASGTSSALRMNLFNTSSWSALFGGKRIWLFYPPEQSDYLYDGKVDPFNKNLNEFPRYKNVVPNICIQEPGEVVFVPSNWWYAVFNEKGGLSLTENFVNDTNFNSVKNTLLSYGRNEELKLLDKFMNIFKYGIQ